ncbi:hypothetical protein F5883DRAFT_679524 [Diaporthe sp. PMI_573]|nr:hypothetical protein F5883DRAFT_679524 [Diaporthaceae sp. PMI_573]
METLDRQEPMGTAAIPLLTGNRLKWAKALLRGDSYYAMRALIYEMGEEAAEMPNHLINEHGGAVHKDAEQDDEYAPGGEESSSGQEDEEEDDDVEQETPEGYRNRTERLLKTAMDARNNFVLFQCLPRDMLKSIVLGTVAWDYHSQHPNSRDRRGGYERPKKGGYGIYVFGLAVEGRGGKWLTSNELKTIVEDLKTYVKGYVAWVAHDNSWPSDPRSRRFRDFIHDVDNQIGKHEGFAPRSITSSKGKRRMDDLIKSLQGRMDKSLELDPSGNTPMIQTPLYVGLSTNLANRIPKHDPSSRQDNALKGSNRAHGLVCALMKKHMLAPEIVCRVALRLWDKEDLWLGEVLICALANGLVHQDGLNCTECGGRVHSNVPPLDREAEQVVKIHHGYLYENVDATLKDLRERKAFVDDYHMLLSALNDPVIDEAREAMQNYEVLGQEMAELRRRVQEKEARLDLSNKVVEAANEASEILDLLGQVMGIGLEGIVPATQ